MWLRQGGIWYLSREAQVRVVYRICLTVCFFMRSFHVVFEKKVAGKQFVVDIECEKCMPVVDD